MEQTNMEVGAGTRTLPRPPVVAQNRYVLPDGNPDPQHANDCGESCVASVILATTGLQFSPGCLRQALGGANRSGLTTANDLRKLCEGCSLHGETLFMDMDELWTRLHQLRRAGHYMLILGYWLSFAEMHWYLAYEGDSQLVWVMDPWTALYTPLAESTVRMRANGCAVVVRP